MSASTAEKSEYYIGRMGHAFARLPIAEIAAPDVLAQVWQDKVNDSRRASPARSPHRRFFYAAVRARDCAGYSRVSVRLWPSAGVPITKRVPSALAIARPAMLARQRPPPWITSAMLVHHGVQRP